jgi:hypothetical protein
MRVSLIVAVIAVILSSAAAGAFLVGNQGAIPAGDHLLIQTGSNDRLIGDNWVYLHHPRRRS